MAQPTALSVMRNRAAVADELRRLLPKMAGFLAAKAMPFGLSAIDRCLPQGGLACGALHEVVPEEGTTPAAFGFIAALLALMPRAHPIIFVMPAYGLREYGRPYGHGLRLLGLDPGRLILVETAHRKDTLWALEEALHSRAPAAAVGVIDKLDLRLSQRLQLAANDARLPLFLLRPAQMLEASAAATRWRVGAAPAARDRFGLFARPRWHLQLERCRNGRTGEWIVEYDHVAHRFSLAAALADPALSHSAGETLLRQVRQACRS
ncbi:MAG TPA: ImuA protein [Xanthobacteraceae bacterium]|nr:ImuA protein [Xanthobacteraceae bacterium]